MGFADSNTVTQTDAALTALSCAQTISSTVCRVHSFLPLKLQRHNDVVGNENDDQAGEHGGEGEARRPVEPVLVVDGGHDDGADAAGQGGAGGQQALPETL